MVTGSGKYDTENPPNGTESRFREWLKSHGVENRRPILLGGSLPDEVIGPGLVVDAFGLLAVPEREAQACISQ